MTWLPRRTGEAWMMIGAGSFDGHDHIGEVRLPPQGPAEVAAKGKVLADETGTGAEDDGAATVEERHRADVGVAGDRRGQPRQEGGARPRALGAKRRDHLGIGGEQVDRAAVLDPQPLETGRQSLDMRVEEGQTGGADLPVLATEREHRGDRQRQGGAEDEEGDDLPAQRPIAHMAEETR
ncbi:MAG: hypothetical protein NVS2B9_04310 [Myxococcales bacterium]